MDVRIKTIIVLIAVVYFAAFGYLGLLHNTRWSPGTFVGDLGAQVDAQVFRISKAAHLVAQSIESELSSFQTVREARLQPPPRHHSQKPKADDVEEN